MASYVKILFNIPVSHLYIFLGEVAEIIHLILNELLGFCWPFVLLQLDFAVSFVVGFDVGY